MKLRYLTVIALIGFLAFLASSNVQGQTKPKRPASTKQTPSKTSASVKTSASQTGNLAVEAGLVFQNGDVKPAARVTFNLLDDDLETILKNSGINLVTSSGASSSSNLNNVQNLATLHYRARISYNGKPPEALVAAQDEIKKHIIATITTDFSGKGEFSSVKAGKYFLMGVGGTEKQVVIWNIPVEIKNGKQSITLDQENAAVVF